MKLAELVLWDRSDAHDRHGGLAAVLRDPRIHGAVGVLSVDSVRVDHRDAFSIAHDEPRESGLGEVGSLEENYNEVFGWLLGGSWH